MDTSGKHELIDFLIRTLRQLEGGTAAALSAANDELRTLFLRQNSETPDNVASIAEVELASVVAADARSTWGLSIRGTSLLLSDIVWKALESDAGVALIRKKFPQLTTTQAEAVLRLCVVILSNLEATVPPAPTSD